MGTILPTLTEDGFLDKPQQMLIKIYEYFLSSDYSQSVSFFGNISSLRYLVREHNDSIDTLRIEITNTLNRLLSRYWNNYEVNIDIVNYDVNTVSYTIKTELVVIYNGERISLNKDTSVEKSVLKKLDANMNYLETGVYV